jgi:hypothetical protein
VEASIVPVRLFAPDAGRNGLPGESLLLIDLINAEGLIIMQTIWATTPDRRRGHRLTRSESVASPSALMQRLAELTPSLWWKPAALLPAKVARAAAR